MMMIFNYDNDDDDGDDDLGWWFPMMMMMMTESVRANKIRARFELWGGFGMMISYDGDDDFWKVCVQIKLEQELIYDDNDDDF